MSTRKKAPAKSRSGTKWSEADYQAGDWGPQRKLRFRKADDEALEALVAASGKGWATTIADAMLRGRRK